MKNLKSLYTSVASLMVIGLGGVSCTKIAKDTGKSNTSVKVSSLGLQNLTSADPMFDTFSKENELATHQASIDALYETGITGAPLLLPKNLDPSQFKVQWRYFLTPGADSAVVISPGRTEAMRKYAEVIWDLTRKGYSVFIISHRGQGESDHLLSKNLQMGHIDHYEKYAADLNNFMETIVKPTVRAQGYKNLYMLAHSMGGPIVAEYEADHPGNFNAIALNAPMMEINSTPYPPTIAHTITSGACNSGLALDYALMQKDYPKALPDFANDSDNGVTHSKIRFDAKVAMVAAHPELKLGGVTYGWFCEWANGTARARAEDGFAQFNQTPTLIFQAEVDEIVMAHGENLYCSRAQNCFIIPVPGASHEILQETDDKRNLELTRIVKFFNSYRNP